jgi:hypothetical protein
MDDLSLPEVRRLVDGANALRWQSDASGGAAGPGARRAERRLDDLFETSHTLARGDPVPGIIRTKELHGGGPKHQSPGPLRVPVRLLSR